MENQNRVPADEKRRWILARLLDIPPLLLGLNTMQEVNSTQKETTLFDMLQAEKVDVVEYQTTLQIYNNSWLSGKLHTLTSDVKYRILNLQNDLPGKRGKEKKQMLQLLCKYYMLLASIAGQQQDFDQSIALLSRTITIAELNKLYDIWAMSLRYRGIAYLDRGELTAGMVDFTAAKQDFDAAIRDFDVARTLESHLSSHHNGIVCLDAGSAYAYVAQEPEDMTEALKLLDMGKTMVGKDGDHMGFPVEFDESKCYINRGKTLIASPFQSLCSPAPARKELEQATQLASPTLKLRHLSINVRIAESYYVEESYDRAVASVEDALELMKDVDSKQNLTRLSNLHKRLKESTFGKSQEVAALGVKLFKVQHPELFH
jgi:tetratricopeptide (TPR) repeat protein